MPFNLIDEYRAMSDRIRASIHDLLEHHHLYQSTRVDIADVLEPTNGYLRGTPENARAIFDGPWETRDSDKEPAVSGENQSLRLRFLVPDCKLFCATCERVEPFNFVACADATRWRLAESEAFRSAVPQMQTFAISLRCQSCKGVPEVFLVRRSGSKLTICGRSPMEVVEVPAEIPKAVVGYFRNALVARQSGFTLCGNLMLRTVIEQFARDYGLGHSLVDAAAQPLAQESRPEDFFDAYARELPDDFRQRFPSLKAIYATLSADIHAARGDEGCFESARRDILKHFAARRLYELD